MKLFDINIHNSTLPSTRPWFDGRSYWSSFELYPDWTGNRFLVFRGYAYVQELFSTQTDVVVKTYSDLSATERDWDCYVDRHKEARKFAAIYCDWLNSQRLRVGIEFVNPVISVMDSISDVMALTRFFKGFKKCFTSHESVVMEEYLSGDFKTFITDTGETDLANAGFLEAFCHYAYQQSNGGLVICNLKGVFKNGKFVLTNPTIHSLRRTFGNKDKGEQGIYDFFKNHKCNNYCKHWLTPASENKLYRYNPTAPFLLPPEVYPHATGKDSTIPTVNGHAAQYFAVDPVLPIHPPPYEACVAHNEQKTTTERNGNSRINTETECLPSVHHSCRPYVK